MSSSSLHQQHTRRECRWVPADAPPQERLNELCAELRVPSAIGKVLLQRGIDSFERARDFFRPSLDKLHDPFLMDGMEKATDRVLQAIRTRERVCVFGDYDVDGTNGAAMFSLFLREAGADAEYYIPDRMREGYGLSVAGIDSVRTAKPTLLIAVDCGITAVRQVDYANSLGIDVVICDHHEVGPTLPAAVAVLDPLKPGDRYPFKGLCGCGVAFKLIQALSVRLGRTDLLPSYLDFVTLATVADIVPMEGENRILVKIGLEGLNRNPRPGIRALIEEAGLRAGNISTGQIVFALAPRINAVGRLGDAMRAVRLLVSSDHQEAIPLARVLEEENRERRKIDEETFGKAQEIFEQVAGFHEQPAIVLHSSSWHPGVIGIVASRMVEKYYKPSVMLATVDGVAKGSARSVPGFDIYQALCRCSEDLVQFGGHKYAAGLTLDLSRIEQFAANFRSAVNATMTEELKIPRLRIDAEVTLSELEPRFVRILREFAPFGPGNSRPVFLSRNLEPVGNARIVGRNHLKFRVRQSGIVFDAIGFGLGDLSPILAQSRQRSDIECAFSVDENEGFAPAGGWNGEGIPQLKVRDLRLRTAEEEGVWPPGSDQITDHEGGV